MFFGCWCLGFSHDYGFGHEPQGVGLDPVGCWVGGGSRRECGGLLALGEAACGCGAGEEGGEAGSQGGVVVGLVRGGDHVVGCVGAASLGWIGVGCASACGCPRRWEIGCPGLCGNRVPR